MTQKLEVTVINVLPKDPWTSKDGVKWYIHEIVIEPTYSKPLQIFSRKYQKLTELPFQKGNRYLVEITDDPKKSTARIKKLDDLNVQMNKSYRINHMVARECALTIVERVPYSGSIEETMDVWTYHIFQLIMQNQRKYDEGQTVCNAAKLATRLFLEKITTEEKAVFGFIKMHESFKASFIYILNSYDNEVSLPEI